MWYCRRVSGAPTARKASVCLVEWTVRQRVGVGSVRTSSPRQRSVSSTCVPRQTATCARREVTASGLDTSRDLVSHSSPCVLLYVYWAVLPSSVTIHHNSFVCVFSSFIIWCHIFSFSDMCIQLFYHLVSHTFLMEIHFVVNSWDPTLLWRKS